MDDDETHLDARGLICPLPVLKARKRLKNLASGARLRVLATDPAAPADFDAFCETTGHRLAIREDRGDHWLFEIEKR